MNIDHILGNAMGDGDAQIVSGSIGWEDEDEYVFDGDDDNDGHTLVRVQLFEGRDNTKPINPSRAQGHKIICHLSSLNGRRCPPKDSRVFVAIPKGQENTVGAGVIFAAIEKFPKRAGNLKPDETVILGPDGSAARIIQKKDGTIGFVSAVGNDDANGSVVLTVGPTGLKFSSPYGSISLDVTGYHVKTKYGPRFDMGGMNIPGMPSQIAGALTGYCTITCPVFKADAGMVRLGSGPNYHDAIGAPGSAYMIPAAIQSGSANQCTSVQFSFP